MADTPEDQDRVTAEKDDEPWCEPEDCDDCGCLAGDFEDSCWINGAWHCPECGAVQ